MKKLSLIIPVYYNADTLIDCYNDIKNGILDTIIQNGDEYEIIMVDDGSKDNSYEIIQSIAKENANVKSIKLSRNFGSHAAVYAGLSKCTGDCATIKGADCQEPAKLIIDMYNSWKNGNKVVLAARADRQDGFSQKLFANTYYNLVRRYVNKSMPRGGFDCFLIDRQIIETLLSLNEKNSPLTLQILWAGFPISLVPYIRLARTKGKSKWTLAKKINLVLDSFIGFSSIPIRVLSIIGIVVFIAAIIWALFLIIVKLTIGNDVEGWTMLMCMLLFSTGLIMLSLSVLSEYIWRILDASRGRPIFIIDSTYAFDDKSSEK